MRRFESLAIYSKYSKTSCLELSQLLSEKLGHYCPHQPMYQQV